MTRPFDPIRLLKELSTELLRESFTREGAQLQIPWHNLRRQKIAPLVLLWETMPEARRWRIHLILQDVHALAGEVGLRVLTEQLEWLHPDRLPEFAACDSRADKVLWAYLHVPDTFDEAAILARADTLTAGRYWNRWNGLPPRPIAVTEALTSRLQAELRKYYWPKELRGRHCRVHHYPRCNGVDYFFAYLDDWPDKLLTFTDDGQMEPRSERYAFTNVFAYDPEMGCLDLIAKGGREVHLRLREAFCRAVLHLDVAPNDPVSPAYRLDHLLDPQLTLPTDPADRIATVRLSHVRMVPRDVKQRLRYEELGFTPQTTLAQAQSELRERLADQGIARERVSVKEASFRLEFHGDGRTRHRTMTFHVGAPNSCNLKSKPDQLRSIGERCLRMWGICGD